MSQAPTTAIAPQLSGAGAGRGDKLVVAGLRKAYGANVALHPTDLMLGSGEFMTLLGPSGSGKTTLLMMVAGLLQPDGGDLWIDGRKATYTPPWERGIGMVFQNYALFPHLTVFENIAFPLRMRRVDGAQIKREVARVLDIVQLGHTAGRLPKALSGGQQQRIALARCVVFKPSIILMDEPLGALDKKLRDQLQLEIKHLHKSLGTTILYVTHDQQEALTMSDRVCLMNGGRIEQLGTPRELYFGPATIFAADFLGESNFLDGRVAASAGGQVEVACDGIAEPHARAASAAATGSRVKIMVRPERVAVGRSAAPGSNAFAGTLRESIFVGGVTRHYVDIAGAGTITALELTNAAEAALTPGERVLVSWPVESTVALPVAGTSP